MDTKFTVNHYNSKDRLEVYESRYEDGIYATRATEATKFLAQIEGKRILDAGCGIGFFSGLCNRKNASVYSLDWARALLEHCNHNYNPGQVIQGDIKEIPFPNGAFDWVLALDVIEHLYDPSKFLTEIARVLRKEGRLLLETDNRIYIWSFLFLKRVYSFFKKRTSSYQKLKVLKQRELGKGRICTHVRIFSVNELVNLVCAHGFEIQALDTFPYHEVRIRHLVDRCFKGRLGKYKWDRTILLARKY